MNKSASSALAPEEKLGFFARIALFFRQVFAELRKVQRPTREELWQMFTTVIIFVAVVMVFVGLLDLLFLRGTLWIFG